MKKVLVIDDNVSMSSLLKKMLHNQLVKIMPNEYEITTLNNGMEAWSWLSEGNIPDLIIEDVNMPLLNGIEFLENLKISGLYKNIPVLVISGFDDTSIRKQCLSLGAFAYVVKPFQPEHLIREVNQVLVSKMFL